jgi:hypothetical protein
VGDSDGCRMEVRFAILLVQRVHGHVEVWKGISLGTPAYYLRTLGVQIRSFKLACPGCEWPKPSVLPPAPPPPPGFPGGPIHFILVDLLSGDGFGGLLR